MNMTPSKSSLDRLPKQLSEHWEAERERFEAVLRAEERVPPEAVTVAVSLDGGMIPMNRDYMEACPSMLLAGVMLLGGTG